MPAKSEYLHWLLEQLAPLGVIRAKAMFGGYGVYCDEAFFAIVVDDVLYVKVDDTNRARFVAEQLQPFQYAMKDGCQQTMSYYPLPENTLEDPQGIRDWAREGIGAALRAASSKRKKKK